MTSDDLVKQETHFAFGKNWIDYAHKIDPDRIHQAERDLQRLLGCERLDGRSFLDIGCGSGLHALAASRIGAARVVGIDIDADSVAASRWTLSRFAPGAACDIREGSILDTPSAVRGPFDVVYSWGVLHHTGNMRRAIAAAAALVADDGLLCVALYRKTPFCGMWRMLKPRYAAATPRAQQRARHAYILARRCTMTLAGKNFRRYVERYGARRGMTFENDVHDWLGGYPYESISPRACRALLRELGFEPVRAFLGRQWGSLFGLFGSGCDEYVFKRAT